MAIQQDIIEEMNLLIQFDHGTSQQGIKVHSNAASATIEAAARLHNKGIITQSDGGYLTDRGIEAIEGLMEVINLLKK